MELTDFSRNEKALDADLMKRSYIVIVGVGGSYTLCEGLCRSNLGKLTAIDFDTVEQSNIVRQGYETAAIGRKKVDALGEHLAKLNSGMQYTGIPKSLLALTETEMDDIFGTADLLIFATDNFEAQSYGNLLAQRYQKPAIWAGFYDKSQAAELFFYLPKVTKACFRCAVSARYKLHADQDNKIPPSPRGYNTIFHCMALDAYMGMISLGIIHNKTSGYEFSGWFGDSWDRNFIQFKMHPAYGSAEGSLFQRKLPEDGSCFTFNAIWQKVEREMPPKYGYYCPDCFGNHR
jgi:hypothetical protein